MTSPWSIRTDAAAARAEAIARQNDAFRRALGMTSPAAGVPGRAVITRSVAALPADDIVAILAAVRGFAAFDAGNDPYGERDFGRLEVAGHFVIWKIEYYAGPELEFGAEDPARSYRTLTIMLGEDY